MAKINRAEIVQAGLEVLDEVGLDALSTRRVADRLGVESATLYWHFRDKAALLAEMASAALLEHRALEVPTDTSLWEGWLADNARSFRRALLAHRDGARLHAGTTPRGDELERVIEKADYLRRAGFTRRDAALALFTVGQLTLGCVIEEQAREHATPSHAKLPRGYEAISSEIAKAVAKGSHAPFEFGLRTMIDGLRARVART